MATDQLCGDAVAALSGPSGQRREMGVGTGFEPVDHFIQACAQVAASVSTETADTQLRTQKLAESNRETMSNVEWLREAVEAWPKLSAELRTAALAVTRIVTK
jgi:hypothetical protein